jgi:cytidine deaminase
LTLRDGGLVTGPYLENAAFNPSLSPLQAAAAALSLAGRTWSDVSAALCVQMERSAVDHAAAARPILSAVAPHVPLEVLLIRTS